MHLLFHSAARFNNRLALRAEEIDELLLANTCDIVCSLTIFPLVDLLTLFVVWKLCHAQQEAHQQVVYFPPPPIDPEEYTFPVREFRLLLKELEFFGEE